MLVLIVCRSEHRGGTHGYHDSQYELCEIYAFVTFAGRSPNESKISLVDLVPISSLMVRYVSHMMPMSEKKTKLNTCRKLRV